jgi:hypothetical protein
MWEGGLIPTVVSVRKSSRKETEMYVQMNAEVARQRIVELHQQASSYRRTDRMAKGDRRADRRTFKMAGRRFDHPAPTA